MNVTALHSVPSKTVQMQIRPKLSRNLIIEAFLSSCTSYRHGSNRRHDADDDDEWDDEDGGDKRGLLSANSANPVTADETEAA